jgi:hypothetical protein
VASNPTVDTWPDNPRQCCILCAKWVCHECWDWRRYGANRNSHQICSNCGGIEGQFIAVRHHEKGEHFGRHRVPFAVPAKLPTTVEEINQLRFMGSSILY